MTTTQESVQMGDTVSVHYKGTLSDGSIFDTSEGRDPLQVQLGTKSVIPGFENALIGMTVGETKTVHIPCMDAYGLQRPELIITFPKEQLPDDFSPELGQMIELNQGQQKVPMKILAINEETLTLDGNHPLAGEDLTFEITLQTIVN